MKKLQSWFMLVVFVVVFSPMTKAQNYPTAEIDRPLALPKMTLEPRGELDIDVVDPDNWVSFRAGTGFGFTERVEAGLTFPLSFAPEAKAGDFQLYGLYELGPYVDGKLRTAGRLTMTIPMSDAFPHGAGSSFIMLADAPVKFKFHDMIAFIGGAGLGFRIGKDNATDYFLLNFDLGVLAQPIEPLALSLLFGIHPYLGDNGDVLLPLSLRAQYTAMGNLDLFFDFGFPDLNNAKADWVQLLFGVAYRTDL